MNGLGHVPDLAFAVCPALIIETRGPLGLRYRWLGEWSQLDAFPVEEVVDAAGSGDWCSAVLIHWLGNGGAERFVDLASETVEQVLQECQATAAVNCGFHGARGAMQALELGKLNQRLEAMVSGALAVRADWIEAPRTRGPLLHYCEQCDAEVCGLSWAVRDVG